MRFNPQGLQPSRAGWSLEFGRPVCVASPRRFLRGGGVPAAAYSLLLHHVFPETVEIAVFADNHPFLQRHVEFGHRIFSWL